MTFTDNINKDFTADQKVDGNDLKKFFESSQNRKDLWDNGIPLLKDIPNKAEWEKHAHDAFNSLKEPCQTILKDERYTGKNFSELDKALKAKKIGNDTLTDDDVLQVRTGMALVVFYHALQTGEKLYWDSLGSQSATALDQGRKYFCGEIDTDNTGANPEVKKGPDPVEKKQEIEKQKVIEENKLKTPEEQEKAKKELEKKQEAEKKQLEAAIKNTGLTVNSPDESQQNGVKQEVVVVKEKGKPVEITTSANESKEVRNFREILGTLGMKISPLVPTTDGYKRNFYRIDDDNALFEAGTIEYDENKCVKNSDMKLSLDTNTTISLNVTEKDNGGYSINSIDTKELETYNKKIEAQKAELKKITIYGPNPDLYTGLNKNAELKNGKKSFTESYIQKLIPDIHGNYKLPLTGKTYITFGFDGDKLGFKNNTMQYSPEKGTHFPDSQDANKTTVNKIYTTVGDNLVEININPDTNQITFDEKGSTDSINWANKDQKKVNSKDYYYNNKEIKLPQIPQVILPGFENKPFNLAVDGINLTQDLGKIGLFSNGLSILVHEGDLDMKGSTEWPCDFDASQKPNTDADLFDKVLVNKPGLTSRIKNSDIQAYFHTLDKNFSPRGVIIKDPQTGSERYFTVEVSDKKLENNEHIQQLSVKPNELENKKIADRMKAINTMMKSLNDVISITTLKANTHEGISLMPVTLESIKKELGDQANGLNNEEIMTKWFTIMVGNDKKPEDFIKDDGTVDFSGVSIQRKLKTTVITEKQDPNDMNKKIQVSEEKEVPLDIMLTKEGNIQERAFGDQPGGVVKVGKQNYYPYVENGIITLLTEEKGLGTISTLSNLKNVFMLNGREKEAKEGHQALIDCVTKLETYADDKVIEQKIKNVKEYFQVLQNHSLFGPGDKRRDAVYKQYGGSQTFEEMLTFLNKKFMLLDRKSTYGILLQVDPSGMKKIDNPQAYVDEQRQKEGVIRVATDKSIGGKEKTEFKDKTSDQSNTPTSSENISSDPTSKDTIAPILEEKPEVSEFDTKFNEAVERITILETITKDELKNAIKTLSNEAQEGFLKDPLSFRDTVTTGQKIDKQYRGNFGKKILTILSDQEQKDRINSDYNIERFSRDNVDKIPNDEKKKLVFSETDLDDIATLLGIKESDIDTLPYAHKDFNGQGIQYGRYKNEYWKVVGEFKNGIMTGKGACIRSSGDKYSGGWEHGEMSGKGTYTHHDGRILSKNDR